MQDLGTCFGQDTRQLLMDGMPGERITVTDLIPDYWCTAVTPAQPELHLNHALLSAGLRMQLSGLWAPAQKATSIHALWHAHWA